MMANDLLTPNLLLREAVRMLVDAPWELRGSRRFWSEVEFEMPVADFVCRIEWIAEHHLSEPIMRLLSDKKTTDWPELVVPDVDGVVGYIARYRGVNLRLLSAWAFGQMALRFRLTMIYEPLEIDHGMPVWFWLGEQAEAA